jgi:stage V sporulation protein AE
MTEEITDILFAAIMGGVLCLIAQLLIDLTKLTPARILVLYVSSGVLFYALGIYDNLFPIFGMGISVPLIGFGAAIGKGVREAIISDGAIGILSGGMSAAAAGITLALIMGLISALIFKPRSKRM